MSQRPQTDRVGAVERHGPVALAALPDRVSFSERLHAATLRRAEHGGELAVATIAVDIKEVNAVLGHAAGDRVLSEVALRLIPSLLPAQRVAHFVGNEFVVLSQGADAAESLVAMSATLRARLRQPLVFAGHKVPLSVSIGIASTPTTEPDQLIAKSHVALAEAKRGGRGRIVVLNVSQHRSDEQRRELLLGLRSALGNGEFRLHFQPIIHLGTGVVSGAEGLLRWARPDGGLLEANAFISLAEDAGLMIDIGAWVIGQACRQAAACARWSTSAAERPFTISVNLSAHQLRSPKLVDLVAGCLAEARIPPAALSLEVTETACMQDPEACLAVLSQLRGLGVELAIDDFGTGFATLTYLRQLPVSMVKIDHSFVSGLPSDARDAAIVRGIVDLTRALGLTAVAEGVETSAQAADLRSLGGVYAQGFYFSPPVPGDMLARACQARVPTWGPGQPTGQADVPAPRTGDLGEVSLLFPAGMDTPVPAPVSTALRALLRVTEPEQVPMVLTAAARALGGRVVPATAAAAPALAADISLGEGPPLAVEADPGTMTGPQLVRWLPQLLEDARIVIERLRDPHPAARPPADPGGGGSPAT